LRLRRAQPQDLPVVLHHRVEMFREMGYSEDQLTAMLLSAEPYFAQGFTGGTYHGWFIEAEDGEVVSGAGITILRYHPGPRDPAPRRAWVVNVYTEPEYRRQGLARQLMTELVTWCREAGFKSVYLHASQFGRPLYDSMGFQITNEMRLELEAERPMAADERG
jgi:GNAT superfamily N-acetyltransferase